MNGCQRGGDRNANLEYVGDAELAVAFDRAVQRSTGDVFHCKASDAIADDERIKSDDVRVLDLTQQASLFGYHGL